jgi:hypothetical protein
MNTLRFLESFFLLHNANRREIEENPTKCQHRVQKAHQVENISLFKIIIIRPEGSNVGSAVCNS